MLQFNFITLNSLIQFLRFSVEFGIIWVIVYYLLKIVRNNARTMQIFKGIMVIIALRFMANSFGLNTLTTLLDFFIQSGIIIVIIIFQPEIRAMLERLGKTSFFSSLNSLTTNEKDVLINELVKAATSLSASNTGALITLEQGNSLNDYVKTGTRINSVVSSELLCSIFVTSTPLHDGAVILQGDRIACASAYFPPTEQEDIPSQLGARHRAAIGISEITDSITIVVSEETGRISIAEKGKLKVMDEQSLRQYLNTVIQNVENEVSQSFETKKTRRLQLGKFNVDPLKIEQVDVDEVIKKAEKTQDRKNLRSLFHKKKKDQDREDQELFSDEESDIFVADDLDDESDADDKQGGE